MEGIHDKDRMRNLFLDVFYFRKEYVLLLDNLLEEQTSVLEEQTPVLEER